MHYGWDAWCKLCEWRLSGVVDSDEAAPKAAIAAMNAHRKDAHPSTPLMVGST